MKKYQLTPEQKRLWFEWKKDPNGHSYNTSMQFKIIGFLDIEKLKNAILDSCIFFDSFKTFFIEKNHIPYQIISDEKLNIEVIDMTTCGSHKNAKAVRFLTQQLQTPFDLTKFPLVRFYIIKTSQDTYYFGFYIPHILLDAGSASKFLNFISDLYNSKTDLNQLIQDKDSLEKYHNICHPDFPEDFVKSAEDFWHNHLMDHNLVFSFPDKQDNDHSPKGKRVHFKLSNNEYKSLKTLAYKNKTTLFSALIGAFNIMLYRYYNINDIVTSYPINIRPNNLKNFFGFFVNNIAMRLDINSEDSFNDILKKINLSRKQSKKYNQYPFSKIISSLRKNGTHLGTDLMNISVAQTNFSLSGLNLENLETTSLPLEFAEVNNELTLLYDSEYSKDDFDMAIEYRTSIFQEEFIKDFINNFKILLSKIIDSPNEVIRHLDIIHPVQKNYIKDKSQNRKSYIGQNNNLYNLFAKQVDKHPNDIALIFKDQNITYLQLEQRVNQICNILLKHNVKTGEFVGVLQKRSVDMIASFLSILKIGAAYIPLDINYPKQRIIDIYNDSDMNLILCTNNVDKQFTKDINLVYVENISTSDQKIDKIYTSNPTAYAIYTSGSTGKPKGVVVSHDSVCKRLYWLQEKLQLDQDNVLLAHFNTCFDASIYDIFAPLSFGSKIVLCDQIASKDPREMKHLINKHKVQNIILVPSLLNVFLDQVKENDCTALKNIFVGGEKFMPNLRDKFYKKFNYPQTKLYNVYGPTEGTIIATCFETIPDKFHNNSLPIGSPLSNTDIYILDKSQKIQPIGAIGEIHIGGDAIATEYLNNPKLTKEKFIHDPFTPGKKLYKTGDLGKYLANGDIEFIGRIDNQVKLRGYRIEMGEIEKNILQIPGVEFVVTIITKTQKLAAYYTAHCEYHKDELKNLLLERLPEYMVPNFFIKLKTLPINTSGKLDTKLLPEPDEKTNIVTKNSYPRNQLDIDLQNIWSKLLTIPTEKININDKFFDLGGDSLLVIRLTIMIEEIFGVNISSETIFSFPTISMCSDYISSLQNPSQKQADIIPLTKKRPTNKIYKNRKMSAIRNFN